MKSKTGGRGLCRRRAGSGHAAGGMISGRVGEQGVLLARIGDEIFAIGSKCTHYGGPLGKGVISGETVRCPWHHACFSLRTGEAIRAPAIDPVARWRVGKMAGRCSSGQIAEGRKAEGPAPENLGTAIASSSSAAAAAGFAAAERLRREGFAGDVVILSADAEPPVDRPNLSKDFLAGNAPRGLGLRQAAKVLHGIRYRTGARRPGDGAGD